MRPQASEGEAQHGPFCWTGRSVKETSACIVDNTGRIVREVKVASEPDKPRLPLQTDWIGGRAAVLLVHTTNGPGSKPGRRRCRHRSTSPTATMRVASRRCCELGYMRSVHQSFHAPGTWRRTRPRGATLFGRSPRRDFRRGSAKSRKARNLTGMKRCGEYTKLTGIGGG